MCYNSNQGQSKTPTAPLGLAKERMMNTDTRIADAEIATYWEKLAVDWARFADELRTRGCTKFIRRLDSIRVAQDYAAEFAAKAQQAVHA